MTAKKSGASPDKRRKYDEAFKAEALRLASESRSTQAAARQLGIGPELLCRWQQAQLVAEVGSEDGPRPGGARAAGPSQTGRAGARYFKKSLGHLRPADPVSTYQHIAQRAAHVPVRQLCQALRVAPAAYHAWHRQQGCPNPEPDWQVAVREAFAYHSQRYGTRRLRAEVQAEGHAVGRWRIRRVLKAHELRAQQPRSFVPRTTDSDPAVRAAPNRLLGPPAPTAPDRVWVGRTR